MGKTAAVLYILHSALAAYLPLALATVCLYTLPYSQAQDISTRLTLRLYRIAILCT